MFLFLRTCTSNLSNAGNLFRAMNAAVGNQDVAVIVLPGDVAVMEMDGKGSLYQALPMYHIVQ